MTTKREYLKQCNTVATKLLKGTDVATANVILGSIEDSTSILLQHATWFKYLEEQYPAHPPKRLLKMYTLDVYICLTRLVRKKVEHARTMQKL